VALEMPEGTVRHSCEGADHLYAKGMALLFYAREAGFWIMAVPSLITWFLWEQIHRSPMPLTPILDVPHQVPIRVDFCPWCSAELPEVERDG
jgi:hypothetical protein